MSTPTAAPASGPPTAAPTPRWTIESDSIADPDVVHLATAWDDATERNIRRASVYSAFRGLSIRGEAAMLAGQIVLLAVLLSVAPLFPNGSTAVLLGVLGVVILLLLLVIWFRRDPEHSGSPAFAAASNPSARLRVLGRARELRAFRDSPFELTAPFEPGIFRITYALEPPGFGVCKLVFLGAVGIGVVGLVEWLVLHQAMHHGTVVIYSGLAIGRFSRPFIWPTYLRIVPGRLDILQYRFLGLGRPRVRSVDLRHARLAVQLGRSFAVFPEGSDTGELLPPAETARSGHNFRFERLLISAALSPFSAPPLPEDELIG